MGIIAVLHTWDQTLKTIFICIVLFPRAHFLWITAAGSKHGETFCFRSRR